MLTGSTIDMPGNTRNSHLALLICFFLAQMAPHICGHTLEGHMGRKLFQARETGTEMCLLFNISN